MDNSEKLATYVTHDEGKKSKNTTQYVLETTIQTNKSQSPFDIDSLSRF